MLLGRGVVKRKAAIATAIKPTTLAIATIVENVNFNIEPTVSLKKLFTDSKKIPCIPRLAKSLAKELDSCLYRAESRPIKRSSHGLHVSSFSWIFQVLLFARFAGHDLHPLLG